MVGVTMYDERFDNMNIKNLQNYGLMEQGHDYFERDIFYFFGFRAPCLSMCALNPTLDGSDKYNAWYVNYVEVTYSNRIRGILLQHFEVKECFFLMRQGFSYGPTKTIIPIVTLMA